MASKRDVPFVFRFCKLHPNSLFAIFYDLPWNFQVFFKLLKFVLVCARVQVCVCVCVYFPPVFLANKHYYQNEWSWNWTKVLNSLRTDEIKLDMTACHSIQFSSEMANNNMIVEWRMKNDMMTTTLSCNWLYL